MNRPRKWKAFASVFVRLSRAQTEAVARRLNGLRYSRGLLWVYFRFSGDLFLTPPSSHCSIGHFKKTRSFPQELAAPNKAPPRGSCRGSEAWATWNRCTHTTTIDRRSWGVLDWVWRSENTRTRHGRGSRRTTLEPRRPNFSWESTLLPMKE
jgi:hypothetical protein